MSILVVLCRFNGLEFARRMRGRSVMFVGDSLGRNQWESLVCLIASGLPSSSPTQLSRGSPLSTITFLVWKFSYVQLLIAVSVMFYLFTWFRNTGCLCRSTRRHIWWTLMLCRGREYCVWMISEGMPMPGLESMFSLSTLDIGGLTRDHLCKGKLANSNAIDLVAGDGRGSCK